MTSYIQSRKANLAFLGTLTLIAIVLVLSAPEEQLLGRGIKVIYVHVALTWTGLLGMVIAALVGLSALATGKQSLADWAHTIGWVALGALFAGTVMSVFAAHINWGAVFWQEPRLRAAMDTIAVTIIVQILNGWTTRQRVRGLLSVVPIAFFIWTSLFAALVLHPESPVVARSARPMQFTFIALFGLCSAGAAWIVWQIRRGTEKDD